MLPMDTGVTDLFGGGPDETNKQKTLNVITTPQQFLGKKLISESELGNELQKNFHAILTFTLCDPPNNTAPPWVKGKACVKFPVPRSNG